MSRNASAAASGLLARVFQQLSIGASRRAAAPSSFSSFSSSAATSRSRMAVSSPLRRLAPASSPLLPSSRAVSPLRSTYAPSPRYFSATAAAAGTWLEPALNRKRRMMKGRPRVATGGSAKGTTVVWGDYGLRMCDHHRRISAAQLKMAEETIKQRLRGQRYRLYKRVNCNVGVFISGNEMRMGKGKGSFDHWAARVAVSRILFEIRGNVHEQVARDAFRLAGNKLPGQYEFARKGDAPVIGITKLEHGHTLEDLKRPRKLDTSHPTTMPPAPAP